MKERIDGENDLEIQNVQTDSVWKLRGWVEQGVLFTVYGMRVLIAFHSFLLSPTRNKLLTVNILNTISKESNVHIH
jgi:hypothetical protein